MSDQFWVNLPLTIIAITSLVTAIVSIWTNKVMRVVRHETNSMKDELVKVTGESERAKGVIEGVAEQKARSNG